MEHSFDVNVAQEYGVHAAVLLDGICYRVEEEIREYESCLDDGYNWIRISKKAFSELFPYFTPRQIDYALQKLIDGGLLIAGNYNTNPYDRTLWYAITEKGFTALQDR